MNEYELELAIEEDLNKILNRKNIEEKREKIKNLKEDWKILIDLTKSRNKDYIH